jgi:diacylglycerol kinase
MAPTRSAGLLASFGHALRGLVDVTARERNMRIHVWAGVGLGLVGGEVTLPPAARLALIVCAMLVVAAEMLNASLESLVDLHTREFREEARRVKDAAAGAVFVLAAGSVLVALAVLSGAWSDVAASWPRLRDHAGTLVGVQALATLLLVPVRRPAWSWALVVGAGTAGLLLVALRSLSLPFAALAAGLFALAAASAWPGRPSEAWRRVGGARGAGAGRDAEPGRHAEANAPPGPERGEAER